MCKSMAAKMRDQIPLDPLTARELDVLRLLADGRSNKEIAAQLVITVGTAKWYLRQIYSKLGVQRRTEAVAVAREHGLLESDAPAPAVPKHNLPIQNTHFVGRQQVLSEVQARLSEPSCRILTLFGPGGAGKIRLAIEAAGALLPSYPSGVYFVPLASVETANLIVPALADTLGLTLSNDQDPMTQALNFLREKAALLVIDNIEHLLEGVDILAEFIVHTKALKLLVTSRERLRLTQEWVFDVQGLSYPQLNGHEAVTHAEDYEAVQLFVQTAQRLQPDFAPDDGDYQSIARICQLVSGLPLAVEMAASWVRVLSCADIAQEIDQNLALLTSSMRNVRERHRSIQSVLDHSWRLMSETEQDVFSKLTVFGGSFEREAAAAVADASLTTLLDLVDKSFVQPVGQGRFAIHELLKQFGSARLQDDPEQWQATRLRHCQYFSQYFQERIDAPDLDQNQEEIDAEFDEIQSAWRLRLKRNSATRSRLLRPVSGPTIRCKAGIRQVRTRSTYIPRRWTALKKLPMIRPGCQL